MTQLYTKSEDGWLTDFDGDKWKIIGHDPDDETLLILEHDSRMYRKFATSYDCGGARYEQPFGHGILEEGQVVS